MPPLGVAAKLIEVPVVGDTGEKVKDTETVLGVRLVTMSVCADEAVTFAESMAVRVTMYCPGEL